jgi:hypothetical protein
VTVVGPDGKLISRPETPEEVAARLAKYAKRSVPKTNHGQILRYGGSGGHARLVEQVLSYDLTVGQGYAFGDAEYWQYLLDLADWKVSDPYFHTGQLSAPGPFPDGLNAEMVGG